MVVGGVILNNDCSSLHVHWFPNSSMAAWQVELYMYLQNVADTTTGYKDNSTKSVWSTEGERNGVK